MSGWVRGIISISDLEERLPTSASGPAKGHARRSRDGAGPELNSFLAYNKLHEEVLYLSSLLLLSPQPLGGSLAKRAA